MIGVHSEYSSSRTGDDSVPEKSEDKYLMNNITGQAPFIESILSIVVVVRLM